MFYVDGKDPVYYYVGNVIGMAKEKIDECLCNNHIPIISSLGIDTNGQRYNPNADSAFRFLVKNLRPHKVLILTPDGGVYEKNKLISTINNKQLKKLMCDVTGGMKIKMKEVESLVADGFDVQITSPKSLIKELFSDRGHGTYVERAKS